MIQESGMPERPVSGRRMIYVSICDTIVHRKPLPLLGYTFIPMYPQSSHTDGDVNLSRPWG